MLHTNGWKQYRDARSDEEVELSFWVKQTNLDMLQKKLEQVSDPNSPDYGHYLSKEQVDALTAPRQQDLDVVEQALRGHSFHKSSSGVITSTVPVRFASELLGGKFVYFCCNESNVHTCALRNPTANVPKALRAACDIITPLDNPLPPVRSPTLTVSQPTGCCFSIGYEALMKPCCLETQIVLRKDKCSFTNQSLLGGSHGYRDGTCPRTVEEAATLLAAPAHVEGCCFSIGYGALLKPCCLSANHVSDKSECNTESRMGGQTGFKTGSCPSTASEAAAALANKKSGPETDSFAPLHVASMDRQRQGQPQQMWSVSAGLLGAGFMLGFVVAGILVLSRRPWSQRFHRPFLQLEVE